MILSPRCLMQAQFQTGSDPFSLLATDPVHIILAIFLSFQKRSPVSQERTDCRGEPLCSP
ncbi:MAG: hypothetical protein D3909_07050 [Candidatus Electrothrix sp. ATG1]|nr:hypothetical protein [Candidatus Electrothrix sp. ATG1]